MTPGQFKAGPVRAGWVTTTITTALIRPVRAVERRLLRKTCMFNMVWACLRLDRARRVFPDEVSIEGFIDFLPISNEF